MTLTRSYLLRVQRVLLIGQRSKYCVTIRLHLQQSVGDSLCAFAALSRKASGSFSTFHVKRNFLLF